MRIVVKIGTNALTKNSEKIDEAQIGSIVDQVARLARAGNDVVLVSSGAVAAGRQSLPGIVTSHRKQAWAAVGQPMLMQLYGKYAAEQGLSVGQCLVLRSDFTDRERYDNFVNTVEGLLEAKALPIINENDVVSMADLTVRDNDLLAAMVAVAVDAEKLILLTNQKALYTANPDTEPDARPIAEISNVDEELERLYTNGASTLGRGGMVSKVRAAKHAVHAGIEVYIADGRESDVLERVLAPDHAGTRFAVRGKKPMSAQKRWLVAAKSFGQIVIDDGAVSALRNNKSLLFPGVLGVKGLFDKAEVVEVLSKNGAAVAYGRVNYDSDEIVKALSVKKSSDGKATLAKEVIHRDYMIIL